LVGAHDPLRSPVRIPDGSGYIDSLTSGVDGGLVLTRGATTWNLGWSPGTLDPADKPHTSTVSLGDRTWIVYHDMSGTPTALGVVADGWGLTVTPGGPLPLDQMEQFAAELGFAPDPAQQSTWFVADPNLP
jgi:hypothetical protein